LCIGYTVCGWLSNLLDEVPLWSTRRVFM